MVMLGCFQPPNSVLLVAAQAYVGLQGGGKGSTGRERVLDVCPEKVHQRVPLFIGSKKEVELVESYLKEA